MMQKFVCFFLCLFVTQSLFSQNQTVNWMVGHFGLEFKDGSAIVRHDYAPHENRGAGIISDKDGNLLFYTDGFSVWNRSHQQMPHGDSILIIHTNHSLHESLVVPKPGSDSMYYIFTVDPWNGQESSGLYYSLVDMSLDNGMGDIVHKGQRVLSKVSNKITAVFHGNGKDVWVIVKLSGSNSYNSFLVTESGVSATPVVSVAGRVENLGFDGQMKASPDGKRVACSFNNYNGEGLDLFDFNNYTGELSNPVSFRLSISYSGFNGLEFSPDATRLYYTTGEGGIIQMDITRKSYEEINASRVSVVDERFNTLTRMQLAPDGRIYITKGGGGGGTQHLGVINNPNEVGRACNAVENGLFLDGEDSFVALTPGFIQNFLFKTGIGYKSTCQAANVGFYVTNTSMLDSVKWSFGEGSVSRSLSPEFKYSEAGVYTVQLTAFYPDRTDTIQRQITIDPFTPIDLGRDTTVCPGHKLSLNGSFDFYRWNTGDTTRYLKVVNEGTYNLTVRNSLGCYSSDSVTLKVAPLPDIVMADSLYMGDQDSLQLNAGIFNSYNWSTGETTPSIYVKQGGWYSVAVTNTAGCLSARSVFVVDSLNATPEPDDGWTLLNPAPTRNTGLDICFINDETGFIVNANELIKTTDRGKTWERVMRITSGRRIAFKDMTGYIIGDNGTIYKSTYNGDGWNKLKVDFNDNLNAITLISKDTIFVTGDSRLLVSFDGGQTWTKSVIDGVDIEDSFFTSSKTGHIACRQGMIIKTDNGGKTWRITQNTSTFPSDYYRIYFVNEKTGFASREFDDIFKTTDGGETWTAVSSADAAYSINFVNENVGFIAGEYGAIHKTTDGGKTWEYCAPAGRIGGNDLYGICFLNEYEGFATGTRGRILKTVDGGKTWRQYALTYSNIRHIEFADDNTGYFLSEKVYKTTDAGETWMPLNTGVVDYDYHHFSYKMCHFFDAENFIVVADDGYYSVVLKTADGGSTFRRLNIYTHFSKASSVFFLDKLTGYISCYDGAYSNGLYKTSDGGESWSWISPQNFTQMHFINELTGFGLKYGNLYSTSDGGVSWIVVYDKAGDLRQMHFVSDSTAYIAGDYSTLLKTTDGGKHWREYRTEYDHLVSVRFLNPNVGFVAGGSGSIYMTEDGGLTWSRESLSMTVSSMFFTGDGNIYVAGSGGAILRKHISYDEFSYRINPVSSLSCNEAVLTGMAATNAGPIEEIRFEYGENYSFDKSINAVPGRIGTFMSDSVIASISGLKADQRYSCRLVCTYNGTMYYSNVEFFTTPPEYKILLNGPYITGNDATLSALVIANKDTIDNIVFEYGVSRNYINSIKAYPERVNKGSSYYVAAKLTGLYPDASYYYRIKASMGSEVIYSDESIFRIEGGVIIIPSEVQQVSENSIILKGLISPGQRSVSNIKFEYGTSADLGNYAFAYPSNAWGNTTTNIQATLDNLVPDTKYYFRISATDGDRIYYTEIYSYTLAEAGEKKDPLAVTVFPNPAGDFLIIRGSEPVDKVEAFDSKGTLFFIRLNEELIDTSSWPPGLYMVRIYSGDKTITKKIYKE